MSKPITKEQIEKSEIEGFKSFMDKLVIFIAGTEGENIHTPVYEFYGSDIDGYTEKVIQFAKDETIVILYAGTMAEFISNYEGVQ